MASTAEVIGLIIATLHSRCSVTKTSIGKIKILRVRNPEISRKIISDLDEDSDRIISGHVNAHAVLNSTMRIHMARYYAIGVLIWIRDAFPRDLGIPHSQIFLIFQRCCIRIVFSRVAFVWYRRVTGKNQIMHTVYNNKLFYEQKYFGLPMYSICAHALSR